MGYSEEQRQTLRATTLACFENEEVACIVAASPTRFDWGFDDTIPIAWVSYRFQQLDRPPLLQEVLEL